MINHCHFRFNDFSQGLCVIFTYSNALLYLTLTEDILIGYLLGKATFTALKYIISLIWFYLESIGLWSFHSPLEFVQFQVKRQTPNEMQTVLAMSYCRVMAMHSSQVWFSGFVDSSICPSNNLLPARYC